MINNDFVEVMYGAESQTIPQGYSIRQITKSLKHVLNVNPWMEVRVNGALAYADTIPPGNATVEYHTLIGSKGGDWCSEAEARDLHCATPEELELFMRDNPSPENWCDIPGYDIHYRERALAHWLAEHRRAGGGRKNKFAGRISVDEQSDTIDIDGKPYRVDHDTAIFVQWLIEANGEFRRFCDFLAMDPDSSDTNPSKFLKQIRKEVRRLIATKRGTGCRLRLPEEL